MEEVGEVSLPEGMLEKAEAVLGHGVERRGTHRRRILAHLLSQVDQRDDDSQGAHELAQASEVLKTELAEH